jgi:hypothetical protein
MKLIPGSKFTYSKHKQKVSMPLGTHVWQKSGSVPSTEFIQGREYTLFSLNPQRDGCFVYTFADSFGNKFSKEFKSVADAEELLGL